ncbi:DUF6998 domain-containing protein [Agromyces mariniharenae]|uniref:DUF6998 domain-containing protein n=1 Tax=Agromyces mariniharenae TaxID=2604423 RepID=A0A5S4UX80_9MICO|nr:hypothetical protein [Agromyces mariniharenae]TYL51176.1 hypothetical protein FYC51_18845 [Agromyces mariniharenae]
MADHELEAMTLPDLLSLYGAIQREFQRRGVSRTAGSIEGEIGERLALMVYGGTLPPPGTKAYDLIDAAGRRIQVKTRTLPRDDDRMFQFHSLDIVVAICIRFERDTGKLDWAREFSIAELRELVSPHAAGPRLSMARARVNGQDVTTAFRQAWETLKGLEDWRGLPTIAANSGQDEPPPESQVLHRNS